MRAAADLFVSCDHEVGCITCGDEAVALRVAALDDAAGLAVCTAPDGASETVETALLDRVSRGDTVLVHAGVALQRLEDDAVPRAEALR